MEIVEAIFALLGGIAESGEGCLCFMQIVAALLDGTSFFSGYKAVKYARKQRELPPADRTAEHNVYKMIFLVLLPLAVIATGLVVFSWVRASRR